MAAVTSRDEAAFSDLINHPRNTVERLERTRGHSLRLRRRGDEDLVLVTAGRAEQDAEVTRAAARVLAALAESSADLEVISGVILAAFPWVRLLPGQDAPAFVEDLVGALRAIEDLETTAPVVQVITAWRHTAEVYADPALTAALTRGVEGDFGVVEEPQAR